jgi:hypothetical protein
MIVINFSDGNVKSILKAGFQTDKDFSFAFERLGIREMEFHRTQPDNHCHFLNPANTCVL